jgi:hypothetical protein
MAMDEQFVQMVVDDVVESTNGWADDIVFRGLKEVADQYGWELVKREGADDPDYVRPLATDEADDFLIDLDERLREQVANGWLGWSQGKRP